MEIYVGVDWSATSVVCALAVGDGPSRAIRGAEPSLGSVRDLLGRIRAQHPAVEQIHVVIQAGAPGWVRLFHAAGSVVHVVDTKQSMKFAQSLSSSGAKDDQREANVLVEMGRSPAHCPAPWQPEPQDALCRLGATHEQVSAELGRAERQLRSILRDEMPLVDQVLDHVKAKWVIAFLRKHPTAQHLARLDRASFEEALSGRVKASRREALWAAVQRTEPLGLDDQIADIEALRVGLLLDRIELLATQLAQVEARLDEVTRSMGSRHLLESVDGIGLKQAATLLQFAFDAPPEHRDQASIKLGASPVFRGSGETRDGHKKGRTFMRRATHHRARRGTYLLGRLAQQNLGWAAAMYVDARQRGQSAATAYRRIARSLLRILTAMLREGIPYDEQRYIAVLKAKGVPWAQSLQPSPT